MKNSMNHEIGQNLAIPVRAAEVESTLAGNGLPTRDDIAEKYKWCLEDMFASDAAWDQTAVEVKELSAKLAAFAGRVGESATTLLAVFRLEDKMGQEMSSLFSYARMRRDEDNTNAKYQALTDAATNLYVQTESAKAFVVPELLDIPEETLWAYVASSAELEIYRFALTEVLRQKPHVLSTAEEELLAAAGEVTGAAGQIFSMFNNADIKFPEITDEDGNLVEVTHGRYIQFLESTDRRVRKDAFDAIYSTYNKHRNTLAAMFSANVKKDAFYACVRHYESARQAALDEDNVPVSVYDNLIDTVHQHLPALHKYLALRKRVLNLPELHLYDLYTPIVAESNAKVPYDEAVETVLAAVKPLGEDYVKIATAGLSSGWTDVYETKGKTSGAYSWGAYGTHPYILLNYQDNLDNMFTLAHELGHAMHTYFSHETQPFLYAGYTIFVAEVASTCNEALLTHYLLQHTTDKQRRAHLINHHLETIRGTVFRQTMFAEFEKMTHQHVEAGGALTPEWLCEQYYQLNQQFFGAECIVDKDIEMEWSRIPHFYSAFYVYKYATGLSAATALSEKVLSEGPQAVEAYLKFLKSGGSNYPIELLRGAGVDMESPEPVRATLELFGKLVDELADLVEA